MEQCGPPQPQIVRFFTNIIEYFKRVVEIVLVCPAVAGVHDVELLDFRQDQLEESTPLQIHESLAGRSRHHDFVELVGDSLTADDPDALRIPLKCIKSLLVDVEIELCGEADAPHHPQRVIGESDIWVKRRTDTAIQQVADTVERIHQFAETVLVETYCHGIDGEVTPVLVILQGAVLNNRFAAFATVTFPPGSHEFHLRVVEFHLRRSKIPEDREMSLLAQLLLQCLGHLDAAAHDHHVDVVGGTLKEKVAHISPYDIALQSQAVGGLRDLVEDFLVEKLCQFSV